MNEILKQAIEAWKGRGITVIDRWQTGQFIDLYRNDVRANLYFRGDLAKINLVWPLMLEAAYAVEDFGDECLTKAIAQIDEWLDTLDGAESGEIVRRIVELGNALQTVPLSPDIVKHRGNIEAMEHLVKKLTGGAQGCKA